MFNKLLNTLKNKAILPWVGVLSDKLYQLALQDSKYQLLPVNANKKFYSIVLGRQHYQEVQKNYPVENKKELVKILKLEISTDNRTILFRIGEYKNKQRVVTFAYVNQSIQKEYTQLNSIFCIPETWILGEKYLNQLLQVNYQEVNYWLYGTNQRVQSQKASGLFKEVSPFCSALGIAHDEKAKRLNQEDITAIFIELAIPLLVKYNQGLWISKVNKAPLDFKSIAFPVGAGAALLGIYLTVMSFYLDFALERENSKQALLVNNASEIFTLQKQIEEQAKQLTQIKEVLYTSGVSLSIWQHLSPLYSKGDIRIEKISVISARDKVSIMAKSVKATETLKLLSQQNGVYDAKFSSDVVQGRELENFSIDYSLQRVNQEASNE